jgi:hypothetical protein
MFLASALVIVMAFDAPKEPKELKAETFTGVVTVQAKGLALVAADKTATPIVENAVTKKLFADKALQGRTVEIVGTKAAAGLTATTLHTLKDGKPHEVYYWCANCQLRYEEPGTCLCCGAEVVLTEVAVKDAAKK